MINFELYEIKKIAKSFNKLIESDLPIKISWDLMKIAEIFMEYEERYNSLYKKIQDKYSEEIEDDKLIIPKENIKKFKRELEDLNHIIFEVDVEKINLNEIQEFIKLSAIDLMNLKKILEYSTQKEV